MGQEPLVFVSHATPDKAKIKPLVDALIAAGLRVFVDSPADMGYSPDEIRTMIDRLHTGRRWPDALNERLNAADCVLLCWSAEAAKGRRALLDEVAVARNQGKLVICQIEPSSRELLGADGNSQHATKLRELSSPTDRTKITLLIEDIRDFVRQRAEEVLKERLRDGAINVGLLPLLAGRSIEESKLTEALNNARRVGAVRPVILAAPDNELPGDFVERFIQTGGALADGSGNGVHDAPAAGPAPQPLYGIAWPGDSARFEEDYRRQLCSRLVDGAYNDGNLAKAIAGKRRPLLIYHELNVAEWRPDEPERIHAWVRYWTCLAKLDRGVQAMPILGLVMDDAAPGWQQVPPPVTLWTLAARLTNWRIWRAIKQLEARCGKDTESAGIITLNVLKPISRAEARSWLKLVGRRLAGLGPAKAGEAEAMVRKLYEPRRAERFGVNHEHFRDTLADMLKAA